MTEQKSLLTDRIRTLIGVTVTAETAAWFADGQNTGNCELIDSASVRFV